MVTVVFQVLIRPYPSSAPGRVVALVQVLKNNRGTIRAGLTQQQISELRQHTKTITHLGLSTQQTIVIPTKDGLSRLTGVRISGELFAALQPSAVLGRGLLPTDDELSGEQPLVIAWRTWTDLFHGDPGIVGAPLHTGDSQFRVVGVMPADCQFPYVPRVFRTEAGQLDAAPEFWLPFQLAQSDATSFTVWPAIGVLKSTGTASQAAADILTSLPPSTGSQRTDVEVVNLGTELSRPVRLVLMQLLTGALFVLAVAAINVASVASVRMTRTQKTFAIRSALGATRPQLRRYFVLEGLVVSVVATALGLLLAWDLLLLVRLVSPPDVPQLRHVRFDVVSFSLSALVALATGLAATSIPAVRMRYDDPWILFKAKEPRPDRSGSHRSLTALAILEVAVAVVLIVWASLLVDNFVTLRAADRGLDANGLYSFKTSLADPSSVSPADQQQVALHLSEAMAELSGAKGHTAAGGVELLPSLVLDAGSQIRGVLARSVGSNYFATLGASMIRGREFSPDDATSPPAVALVNQSFVERFGAGGNMLGGTLTIDNYPPIVIVGVAPSIREGRPDARPVPEVFLPLDESRLSATTTWYVRTTAPLEPSDVRRAISRQSPAVTMYDFAAAVTIQREALAVDRMYALVASSFAAVSLLFAALGLAGLVSSAISARWSEFGLRCAFGAAVGSIHRSLVRRAFLVVAAGLLLGVVAAVLAARFVPWRPNAEMPASSPIGIGLALLAASVALAAYLPLRRVTRLDPSAVLKWQ